MTTERNRRGSIRTASTWMVWPIYLLSRLWWKSEQDPELADGPDEDTIAVGKGPLRTAFFRMVRSPALLQRLLKRFDAFVGHPDVQLACKCSWPGMFFFLIPAWIEVLRPTIVLDRPFVSEPWILNPLWNVPCVLVFVIWGIMAKRELDWWKNLLDLHRQKDEKQNETDSPSMTAIGLSMFTAVLTLDLGLSGSLFEMVSPDSPLLPLVIFTTAINQAGYAAVGLIIGTQTGPVFWRILRLNVSLSLILPLLSYAGILHYHPLDEMTLAALLWAATASLPILLAAFITRAILNTLKWLVGIHASPYPGKK